MSSKHERHGEIHNVPSGHTIDGLRLDGHDQGDVYMIELGKAQLDYLSMVDTSHIPLYLVVSFVLTVPAGTSAFERIIDQILEMVADHGLKTNELWRVGMLVRLRQPEVLRACAGAEAKDLATTEKDSWDVSSLPVTEILFYAQSRQDEGPAMDATVNASSLSVRAILLSSHRLTAISGLPEVVGHPGVEARFLPDRTHNETNSAVESHRAAPHKQDLSGIFDTAAEARRKRRRGGQSISFAASRGASQLRSPLIKPEEDDENGVPDASLPVVNVLEGRHRKPDQSIASSISTAPTLSKPPSRPLSRTGPERKRSSLSQIQTPDDSSFGARNKQTVSKTVMAGMRMHGLQQQRKGESQLHADESVNDDEYKSVYHQTFKGAVFALRNQVDTELLRPDAVREVVERLLAVFCGDAG